LVQTSFSVPIIDQILLILRGQNFLS